MNRVARALLVLIGIFPLVGPSPTRADSPARAKDAPAIRSHTVAAGETLWSIASRYDTTVEALSELNGIADVSRVPAGLELTLQRQPIEAEPTPDDRTASLSSAGPVASPEWEVTAVTPAAERHCPPTDPRHPLR